MLLLSFSCLLNVVAYCVYCWMFVDGCGVINSVVYVFMFEYSCDIWDSFGCLSYLYC